MRWWSSPARENAPSCPTSSYTAAGATIGDAWAADVVVKVAPPTAEKVARLRSGQTLIGFLAPRNSDNQHRSVEGWRACRPSPSRPSPGSPVPSDGRVASQANVAGYKSVVLAASESTRFFPMLTTAAGTVKPATLLVLGVGVAGLQALATAKRSAPAPPVMTCGPRWPTRSARWRAVARPRHRRRRGGRVCPRAPEEERAQQQKSSRRRSSNFDVVITTALVPGRPAPRLVTAAAVEGMKPGSVVVDLAGETGGNCELTEPGRTVVKHGVTITSPLNLPATMPEHASELYSKNLTSLLEP